MSTKAALFLLGPALVACRTTEHPASLHNGDWGTRDTLGYCESNFHAELSRDKIACKVSFRTRFCALLVCSHTAAHPCRPLACRPCLLSLNASPLRLLTTKASMKATA